MNAIADMTAIDLAAAIRIRNISPVEAVEAALARIEERRELNAFITICSERSRAEARHAETAIARGAALGPLHGIPFSVKDLTNTAGVATTQGSALFADHMPAADAVAVARARARSLLQIVVIFSPASRSPSRRACSTPSAESGTSVCP